MSDEQSQTTGNEEGVGAGNGESRADGPQEGASSEAGNCPDCAKSAAEAADSRDKFLRLAAEVENMRRRMERERSDLVKFGLETVFKDLLAPLDSLERALPDGEKSAPAVGSAERAYYDGLIMVKRQLLDVLQRHGLEAVKAAGSPFDPNIHQAIQRVESASVASETVGDEYARGYTLNGRLLRPAMVSVLIPQSGG